MMKEIRRSPISLLQFDEEVEEVGKKAEEILGYKGMKAAKEKQEKELSPVASVLAKLEIAPLNAQDVEQYKTERLVAVTGEKFEEWKKNPSGTFMGPQWAETRIEKYSEAVPAHVLKDLVRIKEELSEVVIEIVHLEETPDPFARVAVQSAKYSWMLEDVHWLHVWEEPGFESKL